MRDIARLGSRPFLHSTPDMEKHPLPAEDSLSGPVVVPDWDDDDDYEDDLWTDTPEFLPDDKWEDWLAFHKVKERHPGLYLLKVVNYTAPILAELEEWCDEFCQGRWEKIKWHGACSYTIIIGFELPVDAIYYKLRWLG